MQQRGREIDVVWFKRDLRIRDHAPLAQALRKGRRVLFLHTFEPADLAHPTTSNRHLLFRWQAWTSLCAEVSALGWPVETAVLVAPALEVLKHMHNSEGISALYSYEETALPTPSTATRRLPAGPVTRASIGMSNGSKRCTGG